MLRLVLPPDLRGSRPCGQVSPPIGSILITSAPKSASIMVVTAPETICVKSTTIVPAKGAVQSSSEIARGPETARRPH